MTSLVIPVADEPQNSTLRIALASAGVHAPWLSPVLIGASTIVPQYVERQLAGQWLEFPHQDPFDPVANTTAMLRLAVESPAVTDPFVWSNDDIYFLSPVTLDDIAAEAAVALRPLREAYTVGRYGRLSHATADVLGRLQLPTWDYERHVPLVVHKSEMRRALEHPETLPRSIYQNSRLEAPASLGSDVKAMKPGELAERLASGSPFLSSGSKVTGGDVAAALVSVPLLGLRGTLRA